MERETMNDTRESLEIGLLLVERERKTDGFCGLTNLRAMAQEVKALSYIAGPMVVVTWSLYFLQIISIMMVGHLGKLFLSSTAIATSFCAVSGFSLLFGMAGALETLCGQAYGAKQYKKVGLQTNTAILSLILTCFPISLLWIFMGKILVFLGQDPLISQEAGKFASFLVPALFAYAVLQPLVRYFQSQSLTLPLLSSSLASLLCHVALCWVLVFRSGLGNLGAALSICVSYWLNVVLLLLYMVFSPSCEATRVPLSSEIFCEFREFFRFAIPSAVMACLEWWSFELLTLMSGFLPNPELEASVLSICLSAIITLYTIAEGIGAAGSTRVANELGAGNARAARRVVGSAVILALLEGFVSSSALFAGKRAFGHIFSDDKEVVNYVTAMAPLICIAIVLNGLQAVFSGIVRGSGWQDLGAFVNLGAYYFVGIPIAAVLGFWWDFRGKGLWIGIVAGSFVQVCLLLLVTIFINWENKAKIARERIFQGRTLEEDNIGVVTEQRALLS